MITEEKNIEQLNNQIRFISHEIRNNLSICDMDNFVMNKTSINYMILKTHF